MPRIDDCARDDDFRPPPERSINELMRTIRAQLPGDIWQNPELIADLQLYVMVCIGCGKTQSQIDDELIECGVAVEDATRLARMCFRTGSTGEVIETVRYEIGMISIDYTTRRNTAAARLDRRAELLRAQAQRMVEAATGAGEEFQFVGRVKNPLLPSDAARQHDRKRLLIVLISALGCLAILLAIFHWIGVFKLK